MPRIPVQPIGYNDAEQILARLGGDVAPPDWQVPHITLNKRLIKITDRPLDVVFSRFGQRRTGFLCLVILCRLRETRLGFCLRIIVNEFHPNLEKATYIYCPISDILINLLLLG